MRVSHPDENRFASLGGELDITMPGVRRVRTDLGLRQFCELESRGIRPVEPDPYFLRLMDGKRWWEWTVEQWRLLWGTPEWPGWRLVRYDFHDDHRGFRMIFGGIRARLVPLYRRFLIEARQRRDARRS